MSYDIFFEKLKPGITRDEANRLLESSDGSEDDVFESEVHQAITEENREAIKHICTLLEALLENPDICEGTHGVELTDDWGIQVSISPRSVTLSIAYWHEGDKANAAYDRLLECVRIIEREMGLVGFDAQLGRILDPDKDLDVIMGISEDVRKKMAVIPGASQTGCSVAILVTTFAVAHVFL